MEWIDYNITKPEETDFPIAIVQSRVKNKRTAYRLAAVLSKTSLHLELRRNFKFTKWVSLPKIDFIHQ